MNAILKLSFAIALTSNLPDILSTESNEQLAILEACCCRVLSCCFVDQIWRIHLITGVVTLSHVFNPDEDKQKYPLSETELLV